jgi:hypothetical protein
MSDRLPVEFGGFDFEIREKVSELDRSDEPSGKLRGENVIWNLGLSSIERLSSEIAHAEKTVLTGEDAAGNLVFSGTDNRFSCAWKELIPGGGSKTITENRVANQGSVSGLIEVDSSQFGPATRYRVALTVFANIIPGRRYRSCKHQDGLIKESFPCSMRITTNDLKTELASVTVQKNEFYDDDFPIMLTAETDMIDFNSAFPGQKVQCTFRMRGRLMSFNKAIFSKKIFN